MEFTRPCISAASPLCTQTASCSRGWRRSNRRFAADTYPSSCFQAGRPTRCPSSSPRSNRLRWSATCRRSESQWHGSTTLLPSSTRRLARRCRCVGRRPGAPAPRPALRSHALAPVHQPIISTTNTPMSTSPPRCGRAGGLIRLLVCFYFPIADQVDAHNVVPVWVASPKQEVGARTLRKKINDLKPTYLKEFPPPQSNPSGCVKLPAPVDWVRSWDSSLRFPRFRCVSVFLLRRCTFPAV